MSGSAETALKDKKQSLEHAKKAGKTEACTGVKTYDTLWALPETLVELEEDLKLLYN